MLVLVAGGPGAVTGYHVALDTMMGRRHRDRPEEVAIDGFLLLDTGEYALVTAHMSLDVFWRMKALDIVGNTRSMNRARAELPGSRREVGSVWLVEATLDEPHPTQAPAHAAAGPADRVFRMRIRELHALERVAIERTGPRFVEAFHVRDMLPAFQSG
jgi:hypothetical protein